MWFKQFGSFLTCYSRAAGCRCPCVKEEQVFVLPAPSVDRHEGELCEGRMSRGRGGDPSVHLWPERLKIPGERELISCEAASTGC